MAASQVVFCLAIFACVSLVAGSEIGYINGRYAALVLVAGAMSALLFSAVGKIKEDIMSDGEGQDSMKLKAFGMEGELRGPGLAGRTIGSTVVTNILLVALGAGLFIHDSTTTEVQRRQTAAIEIANFLSTQPEEARLAIGRRMHIPDALRRQMVPP